jgi:hypothetical protein
VAGLRRRLPAPIAEEAASGLLDTYEHHLAFEKRDQEAALTALAEFGDLATVAGEFTRQAPGRRAARLLGRRPDRQPRLDLAGANHRAARLRRRPAAGSPHAAGRRDQPAQLPAHQALAHDGSTREAVAHATHALGVLAERQCNGMIVNRARQTVAVLPAQQRALPPVREFRELLAGSSDRGSPE